MCLAAAASSILTMSPSAKRISASEETSITEVNERARKGRKEGRNGVGGDGHGWTRIPAFEQIALYTLEKSCKITENKVCYAISFSVSREAGREVEMTWIL